VPIALAPEERERIGAEIERLIGVLDAAEPDADREDNGDGEPGNDIEPDLGWPETLNQTKAIEACNSGAAQQDVEQDTADHEPSLGSLGGTYSSEYFDQEQWARGVSDDREDEHDGREPCVDGEPSLSLTNDIDQVRALRHASCGWNRLMTDAEGPEVDSEPSLASLHGGEHPERFDQRSWAAGRGGDLEYQCEDEGAACEDEGAQCEDEGAERSCAPERRLPPITTRDLHRVEPQRVLMAALDARGYPLPLVETTIFVIPAREDVL
jgi:hypothetical protein